MIVKILRREKDSVEKILAMLEMEGKFYTVENNPNMVQLEITAPEDQIWYIARAVQSEVQCDQNPYIQ